MNWGIAPISATRAVAADGDVLRGFLSDPVHQWSLAGGFVDLLPAAGARGDAQLRLPFGARLHASLFVKVRTARGLANAACGVHAPLARAQLNSPWKARVGVNPAFGRRGS
jgi:hypothetical protein